MAEEDSLAALQGLYRDLCAHIDLNLPVLERLVERLDAHIGDLKALLDKKPKSEASRQTLNAGKITIGDEEYEVNDDFKQQTLELSGALELDELDAAALFMGAQSEADDLDRTALQTAVIHFHRRRECVLLCLRIIMKTALDNGDAEVLGIEVLQEAARLIVGVESTNLANAYGFWTKCLTSMESIETWLQNIAERVQSIQVVGQVPLPNFVEIMSYQQQSLTRQHENLAAICTHMVKAGYVNIDNYKQLLTRTRKLDRHDLITVHYVPLLISVTSWVAAKTNSTLEKAREIHKMLMDGRDSDNWVLRNLHAATLTWWLSEYSGRYIDPNMQDPAMQRIDLDKEATERSDAFLKALDDGAFHFMLSFSQDIRPSRWYDPQKTSMLSALLQDTAVLSPDSVQPADFFKSIVMEQLQTFVDSFITHMPDTLRRLKVEEDDQRRRLQFSFHLSTGEYPMHLERFMVIVAYAFDGSPDAAGDFWNDKESNLYGFLQWAAKRQPTPRIAMFCEMLRAISAGNDNANSAHRFLLEEGVSASGKIRRTSSLSYTHIFNELLEFERDIHEPRKPIQGSAYAPTTNPVDQIVEPESATMLESYLRLLAHICRQSYTARMWILELKDYDFAHICFGLCTDKVESGLRAAAYDALAALLVGKDPPRADAVWHTLDDWSVTGFYPSSKQNNAMNQTPRDDFWNTLADGYDESVGFVRLLHCLVEPYPENEGLNDSLPFPETLGNSRRMPGIEAYVDYVMYQVFAERSLDVLDPLQRNVLRCTCLRFMVTCLNTFNENLVVFANKSSIPVDAVIDTSSLANYVTLHPFARVMEWLFNDKVLKALFAASHHDCTDVDNAASDSPLVQSLMLSIEVMDLVMKLQATYLDIVRPVLKQQTSYQHSPVSNLSLASFEDAVLNNLQVVVDLGLYCGTGHEDLTIASLQLLEKMASSRKLAISPAGFGQRSGRSKIVGILEKDNEAERIGRSLSSLMHFKPEDLEAGEDAAAYTVKLRILDFLNSCLAAVSLRPTIAHILLGFSCGSNTVHIAEDSLWRNGQSLFHNILLLGVEYPDNDGEQFVSWQSTLKTRCWDVLQKLWRSPLTSAIVMEELRENQLLFIEAPNLMTITLDTPWEGASLAQCIEASAHDPYRFFANPPAIALQNFLQRRAAFLDYESRELRLTVKETMPTMRSRIQSLLLGTTIRPGEDAVSNANIFDLFDFIEFSYPELREADKHHFFQGINLSSCEEEKDGITQYSMPLLEQVMALKIKAWQKDGSISTDDQYADHIQQAQALLSVFLAINRRAQLERYQKDILQSWAQVVMVAVHSCDFEDTERSSFILQTLQAILPKLEQSYNGDIFTALQLASLAESLIQKIDFTSTAFDKTGDFTNDRLSQLFRAALAGIYSPVSTVELREYCYQICIRYIHGTSPKASTTSSLLGRHTLSAIRNCGSHLIEVICDDAYSGTGTCKVSALLLLSALVGVATSQQSKYILETFVSLNFIGVCIDNIKHIPVELRAAPQTQVPVLLSYYDAVLALLLRIAQSRLGAAYVLNASLFPALRESEVFAVDPDIGLEFEDKDPLRSYYELMLKLLRVACAACVSRGQQNEQTVYTVREFLKENRHCVVSVFKRSVLLGGAGAQGGDSAREEEMAKLLAEIVDCWTVLVEFCAFLDYEDNTSSVKKARPNMFS